jgi:hypothetical protein
MGAAGQRPLSWPRQRDPLRMGPIWSVCSTLLGLLSRLDRLSGPDAKAMVAARPLPLDRLYQNTVRLV